jgi:hypothetical protein
MARGRFDAGVCVVALSALALAGCGVESGKDQQETNRSTHVARGDGDKPPPRPPVDTCIMLNPSDALEFESVPLGESKESHIDVINNCAHDVILMSARTTSLSSPFSVAEPGIAPTVLHSMSKRSITVRFEPVNGELAEAALVLSTTRMDLIIRQTRLTLRGAGGPR